VTAEPLAVKSIKYPLKKENKLLIINKLAKIKK